MIQAAPTGVRQELKFAAAETAYYELLGWLQVQPQGFRRAYPPRRVNNVYFDRADYAMYEESISGISVRVKVRYRWYGTAPYPDAGQLEIKARRDRVGWKRTYDVDSLDGTTDDWRSVTRRLGTSLPPEARGWLLEYDHPMIMNRYEREYWVSNDGALRVTLDRKQQVFDQRYTSVVNVAKRAPLAGNIVLEVKHAVNDAAAVSQLVATLPLPLTRHSKYCNAIQAVDSF